MNYEENGDEIFFTVRTDHVGKGAILHAIKQVDDFWKNVDHYATFRRKDFDRIVIEIERVNVL